MSEAIRKARQEIDAHRARRERLIAEIRHRQPHLSREQIDDVLDALWVLGEIDD